MSGHRRTVALAGAATLVFSFLGAGASLGASVRAPTGAVDLGLPDRGPDGEVLTDSDVAEMQARDTGIRLNDEAMGLDGYAGVAIGEGGEIVLYWSGAELEGQQIVDRIANSSQGTEIRMVSAEFNMDELTAEGERVFGGSKSFPGLIGGGPSHDGSGLVVIAIAGSEAATAPLAKIGETIGARYPISKRQIVEGEYRTNSRHSDAGSFDAGALIDGGCTAGFTSFRNGIRGQLTAAHCTGGLGSTVRHNGASRGTVSVRSTSADVSWYNDYSGNYSSWIYIGGYATNVRRAQDGQISSRIPVNSHFCLSGAYSGSFCGIRVDQYNQTVTTDFGTMTGAILTTRTLTGGVGGYGDSGGPNYINRWDSEDARWESLAVGLHAASAGSVACTGIATACGINGAHVEVARLNTLYGIEVIDVPG